MTDRLGHKQVAAMLTLMVLSREVSNNELKTIVGFAIDGEVRRQLNDRQLVNSTRQGNRPYVHELTDRGWAWCADELGAQAPPQPRSLGSALYVLLGGVGRFLKRENLRLADVFLPEVELTADEIETRVRAAYDKLARSPRDWVRLVDLRPMLDGAPSGDVDTVLKELSRTKQAHLVPESNRKALTAVDHDAAIRIGGEDTHLLSIEAS